MILTHMLALYILVIHGLADPTQYYYRYSQEHYQENQSLNGVLSQSTIYSDGQDMCERCAENHAWYDNKMEECTQLGDAIMSSVPKIRKMISHVVSSGIKRQRDTLLSLFLHQLLGGYIPDCSLECYGKDNEIRYYICSKMGIFAVEDFEIYQRNNMNSSKQGNRNVEIFMSHLHTFRKEFCSTMYYYGFVTHEVDTGDIGEDEVIPEIEITTVSKSEVGIWQILSNVSLGFFSIAVILKICLELYRMRTQQRLITNTQPSEEHTTYSAAHDDTRSMFGSELEMASFHSLDVNSLLADDDIPPIMCSKDHLSSRTSDNEYLDEHPIIQGTEFLEDCLGP